VTGLKVGYMKIKVSSLKAEYWKSLKRGTWRAEFVKWSMQSVGRKLHVNKN